MLVVEVIANNQVIWQDSRTICLAPINSKLTQKLSFWVVFPAVTWFHVSFLVCMCFHVFIRPNATTLS
uniref:Uncharacterized protein n=1 Tax=Helianthus annuus TaxID=4232 RepID=A0A251U081_HELAN